MRRLLRGAAGLAMLMASLTPSLAQQETGGATGTAGLIEMPNARFRPDGTLEAATSFRHQRDIYTLSFQAVPWLLASFRVTDRLNATTGAGRSSDRSFDMRIRLWEESEALPALAVGLQDWPAPASTPANTSLPRAASVRST